MATRRLRSTFLRSPFHGDNRSTLAQARVRMSTALRSTDSRCGHSGDHRAATPTAATHKIEKIRTPIGVPTHASMRVPPGIGAKAPDATGGTSCGYCPSCRRRSRARIPSEYPAALPEIALRGHGVPARHVAAEAVAALLGREVGDQHDPLLVALWTPTHTRGSIALRRRRQKWAGRTARRVPPYMATGRRHHGNSWRNRAGTYPRQSQDACRDCS